MIDDAPPRPRGPEKVVQTGKGRSCGLHKTAIHQNAIRRFVVTHKVTNSCAAKVR